MTSFKGMVMAGQKTIFNWVLYINQKKGIQQRGNFGKLGQFSFGCSFSLKLFAY
jgi:hypothetical protein